MNLKQFEYQPTDTKPQIFSKLWNLQIVCKDKLFERLEYFEMWGIKKIELIEMLKNSIELVKRNNSEMWFNDPRYKNCNDDEFRQQIIKDLNYLVIFSL